MIYCLYEIFNPLNSSRKIFLFWILNITSKKYCYQKIDSLHEPRQIVKEYSLISCPNNICFLTRYFPDKHRFRNTVFGCQLLTIFAKKPHGRCSAGFQIWVCIFLMILDTEWSYLTYYALLVIFKLAIHLILLSKGESHWLKLLINEQIIFCRAILLQSFCAVVWKLKW